jgi:hypothetical protein
MSFGVAALVSWLITAVLGGLLVLLWVARSASQGRGRRLTYGRPPPYIPRPLVVSHVTLAGSGLAIWVVYLVRDADQLAWVTLGMLVPVALLGYGMFIRWLGSRRARQVARASSRAPAESRLPSAMVLCHGAAGAATVVLVLLTALRLGGT